jgi:cation:H+ antiporter
MDIQTAFAFFGGLTLLILGAEIMVRGAVSAARAAGISPLVVGLTVVAFGTSSPELAVSSWAAWTAQAPIGLGNVIGSNIFNVLFILGISAVITPLAVSRQLLVLDVPLMIGVSAIVLLMGLDGAISRPEGMLLFAGSVLYTVWIMRKSRREHRPASDDPEEHRLSLPVALLLIAVGVGLLVVGSHWFVDGASTIARLLGVSELMIGLTVVAVGTSLPEVATSIVASLRKQRDIAVGNIIGSNLFNLLFVLGLATSISPEGFAVSDEVQRFDLPVMVAVAVVVLPIFYTGRKVSRWEGLLLFFFYVSFTLSLILEAIGDPWLDVLGWTMTRFIIPATALGLTLRVIQETRVRRQHRQ